LIFAAFAVCMSGAAAQDGLRGTLPLQVRGFTGVTSTMNGLATADFDQDSQPDGAQLFQTGSLNGQTLFRIELHVSSGRKSVLAFASSEAELDISAADVNHDGVPDIVVERAFTHQRLNVFLNDGHGGFAKADPGAFSAEDNSHLPRQKSFNPQDLFLSFLPVTRGFGAWALQSKSVRFPVDSDAHNFWPEVLQAQCGARAPASSRAPPSRHSL
jgi:hypothetical protein